VCSNPNVLVYPVAPFTYVELSQLITIQTAFTFARCKLSRHRQSKQGLQQPQFSLSASLWHHITVTVAVHLAEVRTPEVPRDHREAVTSPPPVPECGAIWMRVPATAKNEGAPSRLVTCLATYTHPHSPCCLCMCVPPRPLPWPPPLSQAALATRSAWWSAYRGSILGACEGWAGTRQADCNWGGTVSSPSPSQLYAQGRYLWERGMVDRTWWHTDVERGLKKRGKGRARKPQLALGSLIIISNACRRDSGGERETSAVAVIQTVRGYQPPSLKMTRRCSAGSAGKCPPHSCAKPLDLIV
jgi:hypothetical protein